MHWFMQEDELFPFLETILEAPRLMQQSLGEHCEFAPFALDIRGLCGSRL